MRTFEISKYFGKWYKIAGYNTWFEVGCSFAEAYYSWDDKDKVMNIQNTCLNQDRRVIRTSIGRARIPNLKDPSKLKVKFFGTDAWPGEGDYWVLWTDYDNYSIVGSGKDMLWILARQKRIPKEDVPMLLQKVKSFGYDPDRLNSNINLLY